MAVTKRQTTSTTTNSGPGGTKRRTTTDKKKTVNLTGERKDQAVAKRKKMETDIKDYFKKNFGSNKK